MTIHLLGLNHHTAGMDLRERLALEEARVRDLLRVLAPVAPEAVALSTCNRTEIYAVAESDIFPALLGELSALTGVPRGEIAAHSYVCMGDEAARHLFGVAAGLDSLVVGEGQILTQVRKAWDVARAAGTTGPVLNTLFRYALQAGKEIRSQTVVARGATSVAHAAVELARRELGTLEGRSVLVLGAGETGRLAALNLRSGGVRALTIVNRTPVRAEALAQSVGGEAAPFDRLPEALGAADMLVTASSAPRPLVTRELVARAAAGREGRPLLIVDIAIPRNVESEARDVPGVVLYDMDGIQALCERNRHARTMAARRAERNVTAWVERFADWRRERAAVPLVTQLRADAERARREELEDTLKALPELSERERAAVEAMSRALTNRLLHRPLLWLKAGGGQEPPHALDRTRGETGEGNRDDAD